MVNITSRTGQQAEVKAAVYLKNQGLKIIAQNYYCKLGEIDIIAKDKSTLVFIEVKSRRSSQFGGAFASITDYKQRRIILAAQHYLMRERTLPICRFDAVLFDQGVLNWVKDCFQMR